MQDEEHTVILINRQTNLPEQRYHLVLTCPLHLQHKKEHIRSHQLTQSGFVKSIIVTAAIVLTIMKLVMMVCTMYVFSTYQYQF